MFLFYVFFFKQKTAYEMRISDWSSDVCSSDLRYVATMRDAPARDPLDRAQYADIKLWLPGDILTKTDRTSMAVSLEAREPLLDHRLLEFAATLPVSMRLRRGQGKWLMKKAMERSEEHTSELQSLMRISYAVFCLKKKIKTLQTIIQ